MTLVRPAACAVNAIDPPSGETATLVPSVSFVGVPPSIGTIQIDTVPPTSEVKSTNRSSGVTATGSAVTVGANRVVRRPLASAVQRSRASSADDETNTIVRPSLVAAGREGVEDDLFRTCSRLASHAGSRAVRRRPPRTAADRLTTRHARCADRHALHHVGSRRPRAVADPHVHACVPSGGDEAAAIAVRLTPT